MNFLKEFQLRRVAKKLMEEQLYELVASELRQGYKREGLWAKAIAKSKGNDDKAKSLYIEFRVESLIDEQGLAQIYAEETQSETTEKKRLEREVLEGERKEDLEKERKRIKLLKKRLRHTGGRYIEDK